MSVSDQWGLLYSLLPESERSRLTLTDDPVQIWADKNKKTEAWARAYFEDCNRRKILEHLNSIEFHPSSLDEGAAIGQMFSFWSRIVSSLPSHLLEQIGSRSHLELQEAFVLPKSVEECSNFEFSVKEIERKVDGIEEGKLAIFEAGYAEHAVDLVFGRGYFLICNRGYNLPEFSDQERTIYAYKIDVTAAKKRGLLSLLCMAEDFCKNKDPNVLSHLYRRMPEQLRATRDEVCEQLETLSTGPQKVGNCSSTSCKEALLGALALLAIKTNPNGESSISLEDLRVAKSLKNKISAHARAVALEDYYKAHEDREGNEVFDSYLVNKCLKKTRSRLKKTGLEICQYPRLSCQNDKELRRAKRIKIGAFVGFCFSVTLLANKIFNSKK